MKSELKVFIATELEKSIGGNLGSPIIINGKLENPIRFNHVNHTYKHLSNAVANITPQIIYDMATESLPPDEHEMLEKILKLLCETRNLSLSLNNGENIVSL